ncbi:MAG: DUF4034 domain-containing protein [Candidatus Sulfotelmatobacter sp.]
MSNFRFVCLRPAQAFLLISALVLAVSAPAQGQNADSLAATGDDDELVRSVGQWTHSIESSLIQEKFEDLDRMADQYRREKTRLPGGEWRLRLFYEALDAPQQTDQDTRDHVAHLEHWVRQRPDSVTARVALATSLHRWAWVARGHGYADKVTPEGWRLFNERMKQSQSTLEAAANMSAMCPQWYSEMMAVGLAQSWDATRMKEVFDRGVQFEPGYYYLYLQYANYLLPKWDGHPGDASAFARSSADGVGGSAGDLLYFQIATILIKRGNGSFPVHEMDWDRIQRGYQALSAQYGTSRRTMNQLAFMAYRLKDVTVARRQFGAIGDHWSRGVWGDREVFDRARDWARAHAS